MNSKYPKCLIEVGLPIKRLSAHAPRKKSIRHGQIATLHIWWTGDPLAACRAVTCVAPRPNPTNPFYPKTFRTTECLGRKPFVKIERYHVSAAKILEVAL